MQILPCTIIAALCLGAFTARAQNYYTQPTYAPAPPPTYAPRPAYPPPPDNYYYFPEGAGPYFRAGVGPSLFQDGRLMDFGGPAGNTVRYQAGFAANAAFGYAFNPNVSADLEFGVIGAKINSVPGFVSNNARLYSLPFLGNLTLSFPIPHSNVVPYIGAGAGFAAAVFDADNFGNGVDFVTGSESDVVPAGQIFAGVRFLLTPRASIGVGYKFYATGDPSFSYPPDNFSVGFKGARTHSILFTFQVNF